MKFLIIFLLNFIIISLNLGATASEREGFGLAIEGGSYKPFFEDEDKELKTSNFYGVSIDYQWKISESFTFSLIAFEHGGKSNSPPKKNYDYYKSGFIGAGLKVWIDSFFIGIHGGEYYLTWIESINSYSGISQTGGNGFAIGIELKSGIIIAANREKSGIIKSDNIPNQIVSGNRFLLGYRW